MAKKIDISIQPRIDEANEIPAQTMTNAAASTTASQRPSGSRNMRHSQITTLGPSARTLTALTFTSVAPRCAPPVVSRRDCSPLRALLCPGGHTDCPGVPPVLAPGYDLSLGVLPTVEDSGWYRVAGARCHFGEGGIGAPILH